eukprot:394634-Hanusia_phi.AAC.1
MSSRPTLSLNFYDSTASAWIVMSTSFSSFASSSRMSLFRFLLVPRLPLSFTSAAFGFVRHHEHNVNSPVGLTGGWLGSLLDRLFLSLLGTPSLTLLRLLSLGSRFSLEHQSAN